MSAVRWSKSILSQAPAMMANSPADILAELEETVATCPAERCARILSGMVQLLTGSRGQCQVMLTNVVDGVLLRLTERVETSALVQLSMALAELDIAPPETLWRLASHDNPDVACPVLLKSRALSAADLEAVIDSRGEWHRRAIAARSDIAPTVTEALIKHGGPICLDLIKNPGTKFSDAAYAALIAKADQDGEIAKALVLRPGTPDLVVRKLLLSAPPARKATATPNPPAAAPVPVPEAEPAPPKRPCRADYA